MDSFESLLKNVPNNVKSVLLLVATSLQLSETTKEQSESKPLFNADLWSNGYYQGGNSES